jgi:hypothetical protein
MAEKEELSFGFKVYSVIVHSVTVLFILIGSWFIDKLLLAPPLIVALYSARTKIQTKYDVFHLSSVTLCMILSVVICWFGLYLSLPISISLISNIIIGVVFAIISWKAQEIIDMRAEYEILKEKLEENKVFNTDTCTREELIARCQELKLSKDNTEIAIKLFIDKTKQSIIADELCVDEKSVQMRKRRLKIKLNNIGNI